MKLKYAWQIPIFSMIWMVSCSVGPNYVPPCIEVPCSWKNAQEGCCNEPVVEANGELSYVDYWWQVFDDEELNSLEAWALENNRDLFTAYERIEEAKDLMGIAAADFFPQVNLNPLYTNTGELIKNYFSSDILNSHVPFRAHELLYFIPVNLSYEVDLWGKIQDQYCSQKMNWLAAKKDYENLMLTLTANLAIAYYQLRATDSQIDLLSKVLKTRQKALQINQDRFEGQVTFYGDVTLAQVEVDEAMLQFEEILRQRDLLEDQIAVLIGVPSSEFCLAHNPLTDMPPCIPEGIPSEVLLRRPDIAEAELLAKSQNYQVKEAYAEFFPSLTLTTSNGFESPIFKDFLRGISRYWMFGVEIDQVIFDGCRLSYNLQLQFHRFLEASGDYQKQVLVAFQEVEDALANVNSFAKQYETALDVTKWAEKSNQLYTDRYKAGVIYYINVVDTENTLLNYQISLNTLHGYQYVATIQLIKALGGSW